MNPRRLQSATILSIVTTSVPLIRTRDHSRRAVWATVALCVAGALATSCAEPASAVRCDRVVTHPYRGAVQRLVRKLKPGETGCLRAGLYVGSVKIAKPGIVLSSYPRERAII